MTAAWNEVGAKILNNFAMPIAWQDLDLSAYVGTEVCWVMLAIYPRNGTGRISFRPDGDADDWSLFGTLTEGVGTSSCQYQTGFSWGVVLTPTSAAGVVEWEASAANNVDVHLIGYVNGLTLGPTGLVDGVLPIGWSQLDASAIVANRFVGMLKTSQNVNMGANAEQITRPTGFGGNWEVTSTLSGANSNKIANIPQFGTTSQLAITDTGRLIDLYVTGVQSSDIDLHSWVAYLNGFYPAYTGHETVYDIADEAPNVFTDLDLSPAIGKRRALVFLAITQEANNNGSAYFRDNDYGSIANVACVYGYFGCNAANFNTATSRRAVVVVPTDDNGVCEWDTYNIVGHLHFGVDVIGFIPTSTSLFAGPHVVDRAPYGATSEEPEAVTVTIDDDCWELDTASVNLTIIDPVGVEYEAVVGGAVQAGFVGTVVDLTTRVVVTLTSWPEELLLNGRLWTFRAECENTIGMAL